jgi:murein DD-endopeptidase MepM/ murein hydrolase activator NlpD
MRGLWLAAGVAGTALLSGCGGVNDWDLRTNGSSTADAVHSAAAARPQPDARGVISYPGYQVAVARQGDTVATVAARIGTDATQLASYNALKPDDPLRGGEVLALPVRVADAGGQVTASVIGATPPAGGIDVASIAATAIDSAGGGTTASPAPAAVAGVPFQPAQPGPQPLRHQVARGETAFTIARLYNVSPKDLADWNGLGPDFAVREGQYLLIPTTTIPAAAPVAAPAAETAPGVGSPTPQPPSAKEPLPDETTQTAAQVQQSLPPSPDLGAQRTGASAAQFAMPVAGSIIRAYEKGKNDGIDISAPAGTPVKAAADGTVAAITADTEGTPILVIRHANNLLTVYAGIEGLKVAKGDAVTRGQVIGAVKAGNPAFLHFEVRQGIDSVDPMPYLQ